MPPWGCRSRDEPGWWWKWIRRRPPRTKPSPARLVVREGAANVAELALAKPRINIGRTVDVYRERGLSRRNDLAFAEDTEINRSVSREHAHILFDKTTGEYRLFNDRWYPRGPRPASAASGSCATA